MVRIDAVLKQISCHRFFVFRFGRTVVATAELEVGVRMRGIEFHGFLKIPSPVLFTADQPARPDLVHVGHAQVVVNIRFIWFRFDRIPQCLAGVEPPVGQAHEYHGHADVAGRPVLVQLCGPPERLQRFVVVSEGQPGHTEPGTGRRRSSLGAHRLLEEGQGFVE